MLAVLMDMDRTVERGAGTRSAAESEAATPSARAVLDLGSARILVAEDDEASRRLTARVLSRQGYEVVPVADAHAAFAALSEQSLDLALVDIRLPGLDGLEITRRLRADLRFGSLPILLVTGQGADSDVVAGLDAGASDYITKPVQPAVLLARVRAALRTRRAILGMEAAHSVVSALANAIEAKDVATERHSRRLVTYAAALAREAGLSPADLDAVTYGALLHDIGKIGVPEAVLLKPGPLDDGEWEIMRRHTELGERIAAPLVGSARFGPIIRHHHERWDGSGYPDGLSGDAIPVGARIVGVVDAFDAMTRARVYRPARSAEAAMEELRRGRGRQFDPLFVDVFLDLVGRAGPIDEPEAGDV